jgi:outer membrane protein OmpA-like peptidoglycan-associated protein
MLVFFFILATQLGAETFRFKYREGDTYRILSTISEDIHINEVFYNHADIVNRISVTVTAVEGSKGRQEATFMTTEKYAYPYGEQPSAKNANTMASAYDWGREYDSVYTSDELGHFTILDKYFMPVVRDVPLFPRHNVAVGDTWEAEGHEAQDLRQTFGVQRPFKVPFNAHYTYRGAVTEEGKTLHVIDVDYTLAYDSPALKKIDVPAPSAINPTYVAPIVDLPQHTSGNVSQTIYWDNEKGGFHRYAEDFTITIETTSGGRYTFAGHAEALVTDYRLGPDWIASSHEDVKETLSDDLRDSGLENVTMHEDERGLTLSLENINFEANSPLLDATARATLEKIVALLRAHPDRDLLISGHTSKVGSSTLQQRLSEERARAVADYLVNSGVREKGHVFTRGFGGTKSIAPNNTEEGRAKNRRVEITLLEK